GRRSAAERLARSALARLLRLLPRQAGIPCAPTPTPGARLSHLRSASRSAYYSLAHSLAVAAAGGSRRLMPFDALAVHAVRDEIEATVVGGRVQKTHFA